MKHLQKITLSNIRRFGELVEIDLAKGATIILAPNGTGKTAIFEAVELALTGNVNRLISTDSLIRDLQQQGSVRLDFGGGKYCETLLSKGAPSLLRGDHQELFADSEPQDRPFLLQLTHFLSQKGNNWFVTRHDKEAGKQLEHLSIGREATEVNEIIPAAKRAATSELQNAQREFDEVNKTWQDWLQLVNKRTYTGLDLSTSLISREELLLLMNGITLHLVGFPTQSSSLLIDLKMLNREISTAGFRYQETLKTRLAELSSLRPLIPELAAALEELQSTSARLRSENERLGNANARIGQLEGTLLSESNKLIVQQKLAQSRRDAKARLEQLQLLEGQLNALNIRVKTADDEISLTTVSLTEATTSLNEAEATERILQTIQKAEENLQKDIDRANLLQLRLEQLQALYRNKEVTGNFIAQQNAAVETAAKRQADAVTSERAALEIMGQSRNTLDILSSANDQLKTAIGTILSLYPKDQGDCPVCGEGYKPDELQQRMQETANKVNPGLAALAEQVEINQSFYNEKVTIKRQTERTLEAENSKLNQLQKDLLQIEKDIASLYEENFGANRSAEEVMGYIDRLQNAIRQARVQITAQKNSIANSQPQQTVAALTDLKMQLENRLDQLLTEKHNLKILLENSLLTRQNLEARLVDTDQIPVINAQLNEIQVLIESIQTHINGLKAEITENVSIVRSARDNAFTEELVVSDLSGRITEFRTRWSNAKLSGDLSDEILNQQIAGEEIKGD